jgi:large subunit ribosomal protein L29
MMAKLTELREQTAEELKEGVQQLSKEIFELRNMFKMTRKIEKSHQIKEKKRRRAQILTLLRQREINA